MAQAVGGAHDLPDVVFVFGQHQIHHALGGHVVQHEVQLLRLHDDLTALPGGLDLFQNRQPVGGGGLTGTVDPLNAAQLLDLQNATQMLESAGAVQMIEGGVQVVNLGFNFLNDQLLVHIGGHHAAEIAGGNVEFAGVPNAHPVGAAVLIFGGHGVLFIHDGLEAVKQAQVSNVRLSAGTDLADIVRLPNTDGDSKFQDSGLFIPLNDLIEKYCVNTKKLFEARPDIKAQLTNKDGEIYFLSSLDMPSNLFMMMFINKDWLKEVNMEEPTTVEEFYEVMKAFKGHDFNGNGEADEIPFTCTPWELPNWCCQYFGLDLMNGFVVEKDGTVSATIANPRLKDCLTWLNKLYTEELMDKGYASKTWDMLSSNVVTNQIGATVQ